MEKYHAMPDDIMLLIVGLSDELLHYYSTIPTFSREDIHVDNVAISAFSEELNNLSPKGWELSTIVSKLNPYDGYRYRYTEFVETVD